jgi:hypothetical protein
MEEMNQAYLLKIGLLCRIITQLYSQTPVNLFLNTYMKATYDFNVFYLALFEIFYFSQTKRCLSELNA